MGKTSKMFIVLSLSIAAALCHAKTGAAKASDIQSLNQAAQTGDEAQFKKLLKSNNVNAQDAEGMTPLMSAALGGNTAMVKSLIAKKANLELKNKADDTALAVALTNDQFEVARLLIQSGARVDILVAGEDGDTLLMRSATADLKTTQAILAKDKKLLNKTNKLGETALMQSARMGNTDIVKYLLSQGADTKIKSKSDQTALDIAKESQNDDIIRLLKAKK